MQSIFNSFTLSWPTGGSDVTPPHKVRSSKFNARLLTPTYSTYFHYNQNWLFTQGFRYVYKGLESRRWSPYLLNSTPTIFWKLRNGVKNRQKRQQSQFCYLEKEVVGPPQQNLDSTLVFSVDRISYVFIVCDLTEYQFWIYLFLANWPKMNIQYFCNQIIECLYLYI